MNRAGPSERKESLA